MANKEFDSNDMPYHEDDSFGVSPEEKAENTIHPEIPDFIPGVERAVKIRLLSYVIAAISYISLQFFNVDLGWQNLDENLVLDMVTLGAFILTSAIGIYKDNDISWQARLRKIISKEAVATEEVERIKKTYKK